MSGSVSTTKPTTTLGYTPVRHSLADRFGYGSLGFQVTLDLFKLLRIDVEPFALSQLQAVMPRLCSGRISLRFIGGQWQEGPILDQSFNIVLGKIVGRNHVAGMEKDRFQGWKTFRLHVKSRFEKVRHANTYAFEKRRPTLAVRGILIEKTSTASASYSGSL
jgi:hypothetical protein